MLHILSTPRLREIGWAAGGCIVLAWVASAEPIEGLSVLPPTDTTESAMPESLFPLPTADDEPGPPEVPALPPSRTQVLHPLPKVPPTATVPEAVGDASTAPTNMRWVSPAHAIELQMPLSIRVQPGAIESTQIVEPTAEYASSSRFGSQFTQVPTPVPQPDPLPTPDSETLSPDTAHASGDMEIQSPLENSARVGTDPRAPQFAPESPALSPVAQAKLPAIWPNGPGSPTPCELSCNAGGTTCCSVGAGCHETPGVSFPSNVHHDLLELLAVDIARRSLLAIHPYAAERPIVTLDVIVRPSGHDVHTYARLQWTRRHWWQGENQVKSYQSDVSATLLYHPDKRLIYDISYVDNAWLPFRNIDMTSQVAASYNEDFALRDKTGLPPKFLSDRADVLEPYIKPRIFNRGPIEEPDPRARALRTVRRDSNVTANQ